MAHRTHYAHDLVRHGLDSSRPLDRDPPTDRILAREENARELLVDVDDGRSAAGVPFIERTAGNVSNSNAGEVPRLDEDHTRHPRLTRLSRQIVARDAVHLNTREWEDAGAANGLDLRQPRHPVQDAIVEVSQLGAGLRR